MRVLLIEGDPERGEAIRHALEEARFAVDWVRDGAAGLRYARSGRYALLVVDACLAGRDGQRLYTEGCAAPALLITPNDCVEERIRALEMGADDCLSSPFVVDELVARARALLRRDRLHKARVIRIADLEFDTGAGRVRRGGQEIRLTRREFQLLEALASNEGRVLSREIIQERVWMDADSFSDTVKVHVATLRRKIDAPYPVKLIHTVHGLGYTLRRPEIPPEPGDPAARRS
jgi:DNA-binding response OmpR family regulator